MHLAVLTALQTHKRNADLIKLTVLISLPTAHSEQAHLGALVILTGILAPADTKYIATHTSVCLQTEVEMLTKVKSPALLA